MEARTETRSAAGPRVPGLLVGLAPLAVLAAAIALFVALGSPGLERIGVPQERLAVERTVMRPGEIELHVRNDGADPVRVRQVLVNDSFAPFGQSEGSIGRLEAATLEVQYPWIEGQDYELALVTETGATIDHSIAAATETPESDAGFYGLMALIGLYVGVIPVAIGMLWLPWVRRTDERWIGFILALTVGLLVFLGIEALLEGFELGQSAPGVLGGPALVFLGGAVAYLALAAVDGHLRARRDRTRGTKSTRAVQLAFLVALGIGLHNLGEGLAIGSAYAVGALALGTSLVVGFAVHNTTEGLAIVAPVSEGVDRARWRTLALLGLLAGAPAIVGAWVGASLFDPSLAAFMFGVGAGAIAQVVIQIGSMLRDSDGRLLHPLAVGGLLAGLALMYFTNLLIAV